mmetsp:Transcript_11937/g.33621  ORF Transcript_11937/g.33621 Transcript_11937/m.33621 type:complete len:303 (-) Transcript_11937:257-1165(-)
MRTAIVFGASRGMGRDISIRLAEGGYNVCVAAKTSEKEVDSERGATKAYGGRELPGTVEDTSRRVEQCGRRALPMVCDCRKEEQIAEAVRRCEEELGTPSLVVYCAGAIRWASVAATPLKRYDLMHDVNARGFYAVVQHTLPSLQNQGGSIVAVCPPIYSRFVQGKAAYAMTKYAMSVLVLGLGHDLERAAQQNGRALRASVCGLWPATAIDSYVTREMGVTSDVLRSPAIFSDAVLAAAAAPKQVTNGQLLIDEDFLRDHCGIRDFSKYRCNPEVEPPRMMPVTFPSLRVQEEDDKPKPKL